MRTIETLVSRLNEIAPDKRGYLYYSDFASCYGGYRLVAVNPNGGGHAGAFGKSSCCDRVSKKEFVAYLDGLVSGVETALNL